MARIPMNTEVIEQFRAATLGNSATTTFSQQFTLGEGWVMLHLNLNISLTVSGGSGVPTDGLLRYIKGVSLRTDKGEIICNSLPGRALSHIAQVKCGSLAVADTLAASTAVYIQPIEIWFSDPKRLNPHEAHTTILDTSRYGSLTLQITLGSVSDLLTTVSGDTVATTVDCYVERFRGLLPPNMKPSVYVQYGVQAPQSPSNQTFIDLERASNLQYKRLFLYVTTSAAAGVACDGAASNTQIVDFDVEATEKFIVQNALVDPWRRITQAAFEMEAIPAGRYVVSMVDKSRSLATMFASGGQSRLRFNWRNGSLGTTPQVTACYEGVRPLSDIVIR